MATAGAAPACRKEARPSPHPAARRLRRHFLHGQGGCPWRRLHTTFPPWKTVCHHFHQWSRNGLLGQLNTPLRAWARQAEDKRTRPSAGVLDSQTVRSNPHGGAVGYDAGKKTRGRKRFLLVDTLGLVLGAAVQPAHTPERAGAMALLQSVLPHFTWLRQLWVAGG